VPLNIPNLVTMSRIILIPLLIGIFYLPWFTIETKNITATAVFIFAGITDWLDGYLARKLNQMSAFGAFLDPVADKLFMATAFAVVLFSGRLTWYEILGVLARDVVATVAFVVTLVSGKPASIPARLGGKAVTLAQMLTLAAALTDSSLVRPLAWATAAIALYAIWDYQHAATRARRPVGG
jgi:CDP-diacylglycerol--glycerol-3-phosphate 3-phosphatidyltransferase/cardiolipin synthase